MKKEDRQWWKETVTYQVYPRSFSDSNDDGIGDLRGIIQKLDYLRELGIGLLWVSPFCRSPMHDNGYDISDYYQVDPIFGTNGDAEELIGQCRKRDIRVMMDLVVNHCSSEHEWFQKAAADPACEEADYFIFRRTEDGTPPNNWRSNFGGPAWTRLSDGRWYLHTFDYRQPDLNWENPRLRGQIYTMMNWWLERGVAGFRVDAITFIKKDLSFASYETENGLYPIENFQNYPGIGVFLKEMKQKVFLPHGCVTVAEAAGVGYDDLSAYMGEDGHFSMIFDFTWDHLIKEGKKSKGDPHTIREWREKVFESQRQMQRTGWSPLFLENHDQARCPNKFFDADKIGCQSITMLAATYFFLRGTPFIYQGQEIGMTNYPIRDARDVFDTAAKTRIREAGDRGNDLSELLDDLREHSRDHARTPFQWDDTPFAGFSKTEPWIPVHPDYREVHVRQQQADPSSVLCWYKQLIALRRSQDYKEPLVYGDFSPIAVKEDCIVAYSRSFQGRTLVVLSLFSETGRILDLPLPLKKIILSNDEIDLKDGRISLKGYQTVLYEAKTNGKEDYHETGNDLL